MSTQTYCTQNDIEAIWPPADLLASVDDDASGTLSATEEAYITRAIERAANFMNARLELRYRLSDLAANSWCRDANAAIAAYWLSMRRGDRGACPLGTAVRRVCRRAGRHRRRQSQAAAAS